MSQLSDFISNLQFGYNRKIKPVLSALYEVVTSFYLMFFRIAVKLNEDFFRDVRNNTLSLKSASIFIGYICYCLFYLYKSFSHVYSFYNFGFLTTITNDLKDNKNFYLCYLVFIILRLIFNYVYTPLCERFYKYKALKANFPTIINLFNNINLKHNNKIINQTYAQYILKNESDVIHINSNYKTFRFKKYVFVMNGFTINTNGFEILEHNIDKLDFNNFQLEYLFFNYSHYTKTHYCKFLNDVSDFTKKYPKLSKKILNHCSTMNQRIDYLKNNIPICDDIINHIITKN